MGFTVSKNGIQVDPLKVEVILSLPPPSTLHWLQIFQWKEKNLCRFILIMLRLWKDLCVFWKKYVPFIWDDQAQHSFDALKHALTHTPLLHPPNYMQDYTLYLVASISTIRMVLVQEDDDDEEHIIYYLSKSLEGPKIQYSHVEKLALVAAIVV